MLKKVKPINLYFLLMLFIVFTCLSIYFNFIFGNNFFIFGDIGSDTKEQYLLWYNSIAEKLRSGTFSFWNFQDGFGKNIISEGLYDPFQFLICLFGAICGSSNIPFILIYINILKIVLAGLSMFYFLNCFQISDKIKIIAAYMYAFNGFIILWGQHYAFATIVVYLPLLFAAIEQTLHNRKRWIFVTLITFVIGIYSLYFCYMSLITISVYFVIRLFQSEDTIKNKFKIFVRGTLAIVLGLALSCFALLPNAYVILNVSARVPENISIFQKLISSFVFFPKEYYKMFLYRMFSSNLQGSVSYTGYINYYETLNFCSSNLLVFLVIQYAFSVFDKKRTSKQKTIRLFSLLLLAITFFVPTGGLIYNGFCYTMQRWSFVVIPILILISAKELDEIIKTKNISILGCMSYLFLACLVYYKAFKNFSKKNDLNYSVLQLNTVILFFTGVLMFIIIFLFVKKKIDERSLFIVLAILVSTNLMSDSFISANHRIMMKKNSSYISDLYNEDVKTAISYLNQNDVNFYRTEKTFAKQASDLESLAQGYDGISTYNSIINKNTLEFIEKLWPSLRHSHFAYCNIRQTLDDHFKISLVGVKYLLSNASQNMGG